MKTVAIHQSQYLPWAPYFKKIAMADHFVVMDTVQFQKNGVQNRNQIRNDQGPFWLTIPVTGNLEDLIAEKKPANDRWRNKHWLSIRASYQRAPYWSCYSSSLEQIYSSSFETLYQVNEQITRWILRELAIDTPVTPLSTLNLDAKNSELVLQICLSMGAECYLSGTGGKHYLDERRFQEAGVKITYMESTAPYYRQFHGEFVPALSMLDWMMNEDIETIRCKLLADIGKEGNG